MVGYGKDSPISRKMFLVLAASFFCFSPAVANLLDLNEGAPCQALGGESGTCQQLTACYNPGDFKKEHPPICTFNGRMPVICCPDSTGIKEEDFRFKYANKAAQYCKNNTASCEKSREIVSTFTMEEKTAVSYGNNFMAIIGYGFPPNQVWKCSGTIVTSRFILSAASCAEPKDLGPATWARLGGLQGSNGVELVSHFIAERMVYPDYNEASLYNDIALFLLEKEVSFNMWLGPICLHNGRLVKGEVTSTLWVIPQDNPDNPELMVSKMIIEEDEKCKSLTPASYRFPKGIKENLMFCASVEEYNPDSCPVETAGGPILVREGGECLATQIGIASYRQQNCGDTNYPTVYTRVAPYISWIEGIVFHVIYN